MTNDEFSSDDDGNNQNSLIESLLQPQLKQGSGGNNNINNNVDTKNNTTKINDYDEADAAAVVPDMKHIVADDNLREQEEADYHNESDNLTTKDVFELIFKHILPEPPPTTTDDSVENINNEGEGEGSSSSTSSFSFDAVLDYLAMRLVRCCIRNNDVDEQRGQQRTNNNNIKYHDFVKNSILLMLLVIGVQGSFLSWGYLQEAIMTTTFQPTTISPDGRFPSATFCVLVNRIAALFMSSLVLILCRHHGGGGGGGWRMIIDRLKFQNSPPLRVFCPCAVSNTLCSWVQYSSLRYVSFPVQTLFKSCKIVVVMIVGKLLNQTNYAWTEYVEAALITIGVAVFSIYSKSYYNDRGNSVIGIMLLICYLFLDSFTSQWQEKIYLTYGRRNVDPFQMMFGVNIFATFFTSISFFLLEEGGMVTGVFEFLQHNPICVRYLVMTAIVSSIGQMVIFCLIREFGPMIFTIVMTVRQLVSIVLSSILFGHQIGSNIGIIGAILVFVVVAYQIRRNYTLARQPDILQQ